MCAKSNHSLILRDNANDRQVARIKTFDILGVPLDEFRYNGTVDRLVVRVVVDIQLCFNDLRLSSLLQQLCPEEPITEVDQSVMQYRGMGVVHASHSEKIDPGIGPESTYPPYPTHGVKIN